MFTLKTFLRELILPPTLPLVLMLVGALLGWGRRRFGRTIFLLGFISMWALCTPAVADLLCTLAEGYPALNPALPVNAQAIVVLGGGMQRAHAPEYNGAIAETILLERLDLAAFLAKHYSLPVAVSGAVQEVPAMQQTLSRDFGVQPRWIEGNSRDTYENAQLSAKILLPQGIKRIILVTSSTHERRATHEFMAAGFEVTPAPIGVVAYREPGVFKYMPSPLGLMRSYAAVYELLGEPMRRLLSVLRIRETFDHHVQAAAARESAVAGSAGTAGP